MEPLEQLIDSLTSEDEKAAEVEVVAALTLGYTVKFIARKLNVTKGFVQAMRKKHGVGRKSFQRLNDFKVLHKVSR